MIYRRVFTFPMSHFNGEEQYVDLATSKKLIDECAKGINGAYNNQQLKGKLGDAINAYRLLMGVLKNVHGHNLIVTIEGRRTVSEDQRAASFVVTDEDLDELLDTWRFMNLSVHPDFDPEKNRPGCELIALRLKQKLIRRYPGVHFRISVAETEGQVAVLDFDEKG